MQRGGEVGQKHESQRKTVAGWKDRDETHLPGLMPRMRASEVTGVGSEGGGTVRGSLNATLGGQVSLSGEAHGQSCVFRIWIWPSGGEGQGNSVKQENSARPA